MNANKIAIFAYKIANLAILCYIIHKSQNRPEEFFVKLSELHTLIQTIRHRGGDMDIRNHSDILLELGLEPGALYQELEMDSPYVDTHQDSTHTSSHVNLHSHSFYELLYCRNAKGVEYLVGAERYRLEKGDILLIAPGLSHRPILPAALTEPYIRDVIWISKEFMDEIVRMFPYFHGNSIPYSALLRLEDCHQEILGQLFRIGILEAEKRAPGWEMAVMGNTMQILTQLYRFFIDRSASPLKAEKPELPDRVMAYVETYLDQHISLADVARQFYVSESTISQTFRKKLGVSFHRYVTQRRLIAAKAMITGGTPLETVGRQVGFADYSSFYRAFKQEYGISPRQYKKLQEETN